MCQENNPAHALLLVAGKASCVVRQLYAICVCRCCWCYSSGTPNHLQKVWCALAKHCCTCGPWWLEAHLLPLWSALPHVYCSWRGLEANLLTLHLLRLASGGTIHVTNGHLNTIAKSMKKGPSNIDDCCNCNARQIRRNVLCNVMSECMV